jgi:hypothetical protein
MIHHLPNYSIKYKKVGPAHEFKVGDRVIDLMFPKYGPATLSPHPYPENIANGCDKWLISFGDKSLPVYWLAKNGSWSSLGVIIEEPANNELTDLRNALEQLLLAMDKDNSIYAIVLKLLINMFMLVLF